MVAVAIEVENLTKKFKGFKAVDELSMRVLKGSIHGLLGPNGAGKTTTIKCILGVLTPDNGIVRVLGVQVKGDTGWFVKRNVGYVPENPRVPEWCNVYEIMYIYARLQGLSSKDCRSAILRSLETVGLSDKLQSKVGKLSRGERQRLMIAQAIVHEPELLILDEPFIGLDPEGIVEIKNLISELSASGTTVFISSHVLKELEDIVTDLTIMFKGKRVFEGDIEKLKITTSDYTVLIVTVEKETPDPMEVFSKLSFIKSYEKIKPKTYRLYLRTDRDYRGELSRALFSSGITITSMSVEEDLRTLYLRLIGLRGEHTGR